jgi:hypothetical protein
VSRSVSVKIAGCIFYREVSSIPLPVFLEGGDISRREPSVVVG